MSSYNLDEYQQKAVAAADKNVLVVAAPGSGYHYLYAKNIFG